MSGVSEKGMNDKNKFQCVCRLKLQWLNTGSNELRNCKESNTIKYRWREVRLHYEAFGVCWDLRNNVCSSIFV